MDFSWLSVVLGILLPGQELLSIYRDLLRSDSTGKQAGAPHPEFASTLDFLAAHFCQAQL